MLTLARTPCGLKDPILLHSLVTSYLQATRQIEAFAVWRSGIGRAHYSSRELVRLLVFFPLESCAISLITRIERY